MNKIAEIIINNSARQLGKVFHYLIPESISNDIKIGHIVSVPFGKSNKGTEGFVIGFVENSEIQGLKSINNIISDEFVIKKELVDLAFDMSREYMCNVSDCLRLMFPPTGQTGNMEKAYIIELLKTPVEINDLIGSRVIKGEKQIQILRYLVSSDLQSASEVLKQCMADYGTLRSLEKKGVLRLSKAILDKNPLAKKEIERTYPFTPNQYQKKAIDTITELIDRNSPAEVLIHGVTGSGKTEVYLQLIAEVLNRGGQAIVLVPEISLTPQMIQRFVGRFGQEVAILHSRLSDGERADQWYKIKQGKVSVVVGARSAVFAPFNNPGIIIIDEEHEHTYKSEKSPRYHAREVARKRCKMENCVLVLGSATPSMESYYKAQQSEINLVELSERANESILPDVEIVDMRNELEDGNKSVFSRRLYESIKQNLDKGNQTILFLNRRGYSSFVLCRKCGYVPRCKYCNISLTYHLHGDKLVCHYCGYNRANFKLCPSCKSEYIRHFGLGTQKLEEEVKKNFPKARVLRMDMDTTSRKNSHEEILDTFRKENADILIGTQMIAKGHDFPNVTLVGVISADLMLNLEDFRSTEKTFQLLTQVAGRAGRAQKEGKVVIQTYEVDNFSIQASKHQDYMGFYKQEVILREELKYPPFCDIVSILVTGVDEVKVKEVSSKIESSLRRELEGFREGLTILNAVPTPISRIKNRFRWRIIIKCKTDDQLRQKLNDIYHRELKRFEKWCSIGIDVNPVSML